MTEAELLREEVAELEAQIFRIKGSTTGPTTA